jgi:hypothetical protein
MVASFGTISLSTYYEHEQDKDQANIMGYLCTKYTPSPSW